MLSYTVRLGRGLFTETFAAVLESGGERLDVVVKKPRRGGDKDEARAEALEKWGKAQLQVEGSHLAAVLEVGRTDEGPYVIQERVEGSSLGAVLAQVRKKRRSLRPNLVLRVAREVAAALAELHAAGQVHGRLDPDEILISYEGEVRLGDAGLFQLAGLEPEPAPPSIYARPGRELKAPSPGDDLYALALITLESMIGGPIWTKSSLSLDDAVKALIDMSALAQADPALAKGTANLVSRALELAGAPIDAETFGNELEALSHKYDARAKPSELGAFVRVVTPLKTKDDAPTMVAGVAPPVETVDDNNNPFKVGTVAVNAEVLAFLERGDSGAARPRGPSQGMPAPAAPRVLGQPPETISMVWPLGLGLLVLVAILLRWC